MVDQAEFDELLALLANVNRETSADDVSAVQQLLDANPGIARAKGKGFGADGPEFSALMTVLQKSNSAGGESKERNEEIARMLIAAGADVNEDVSPSPDEGSIPLLFAAIVNEDSRNPNITKQLIAAGADVNAPIRMGDDNCRMLSMICEARGLLGGPAMFAEFKMFLEAGADVNAPNTADGDSVTCLCEVAMQGFTTMMQMLIEKGADVNAVSTNVSNRSKWMKQIGTSCTPLMLSALKGDMEAVVLLLKADADVTIKSSQGKTAADIADDNGHGDVASLLSVLVKAKAGSSAVDSAEASVGALKLVDDAN